MLGDRERTRVYRVDLGHFVESGRKQFVLDHPRMEIGAAFNSPTMAVVSKSCQFRRPHRALPQPTDDTLRSAIVVGKTDAPSATRSAGGDDPDGRCAVSADRLMWLVSLALDQPVRPPDASAFRVAVIFGTARRAEGSSAAGWRRRKRRPRRPADRGAVALPIQQPGQAVLSGSVAVPARCDQSG